MPKYSFVIPVYKVEKYLDQCVESILCQTYKDYEIILVDDGSPDNCPAMCDAWAEKENRIRAIHKENGGASSARNLGIDSANGDFIVFLDSDDYWDDRDGLKKIDSMFSDDIDIVVFPAKTFFEKDNKFSDDRYEYPEIMNDLGRKDCLKYMIEHDLFCVHPGKKAFRKKYLVDNNLYFVVGIRAEDIEMYIRSANCLPKYRFLNDRIYVYREHEGSVTATVGGKHLNEHLSFVENFIKYPFVDGDVRDWIYSYLAYSMSIVLAHVQFIKPENSKDLDQRIKSISYLFDYTIYPRTKLISKFYHIFGFRMTKLFLGIYLGRNWKK